MKKINTKKKEETNREEFNGRTNDRSLHERIAERAYALHQKRGEHHGHDLEDWLEAERILLSEQSAGEETAAPAKEKPSDPAPRGKTTRKRGAA